MHPVSATEPLDRLLVRTGQALQRFTRQVAAAHGLSATALDLLGVLTGHGALAQRDLAGHLRLAPATLTPVLDALESAGAVVRTRDGTDRRVVRVSITERGRRRHAAVVHEVRRAAGRLPQASAEEAEIIRAHLLALLDAVDGAGITATSGAPAGPRRS